MGGLIELHIDMPTLQFDSIFSFFLTKNFVKGIKFYDRRNLNKRFGKQY